MSSNEFVLHKDYENFASYLRIDYEDYVELLSDFEFDEDQIEYALSI